VKDRPARREEEDKHGIELLKLRGSIRVSRRHGIRLEAQLSGGRNVRKPKRILNTFVGNADREDARRKFPISKGESPDDRERASESGTIAQPSRHVLSRVGLGGGGVGGGVLGGCGWGGGCGARHHSGRAPSRARKLTENREKLMRDLRSSRKGARFVKKSECIRKAAITREGHY